MYNNIYNFKNPIRHFINIDKLTYPPNISILNIDDTCWTQPFKFRIQKDENAFRTLKIPNILQTICAYEYYKSFPEFSNPQKLDKFHKRLSANLDTGDFEIGAYDKQLEADFNNLCVFDNLLKLDIKEYYGRIYTHYLDYGICDRYITNLNFGATNGLIMGNYISLYFAEQYLAKISDRISQEISSANIPCDFSYFSDDFYFFCNEHDNNAIIQIFDKVLEEFDLERNNSKSEIWDYSSYNQDNLMTRYWKRINYYCNTHFDSDSDSNKLALINQLLYRSSALKTEKQKRIFINNFFKSKYFQKLQTSDFEMQEYDYHQLCFLFRSSPESLIYSIQIFKLISNFKESRMEKFFNIRYTESLQGPFHDVQLYFFYALTIMGFTDIIDNASDLVLHSDNQLLISYYIINKKFSGQQLNSLEKKTDEQYWFQNYHLILYRNSLFSDIENSIEKYLLPKKCLPFPNEKQMNAKRRQSYMDFYKTNLKNRTPLLNTVLEVETAINDYLELRFEEEALLYLE